MTYSPIAELRNRSPYSGTGSLTREQFLFFEMRTTAKLMTEGLSDEEIHQRIYEDNLFQFPTEKSIKLITSGFFFIFQLHLSHPEFHFRLYLVVQPFRTSALPFCEYQEILQQRTLSKRLPNK